MGGYAWVTLATNNSYSLGALVLAHSLKKSNTAHKLAVLITPAVSQSMRDQLQTVFDVVKMVDVLDSKDEAHLALLKRPDLGITFTKIHCWRLIEFEKCVFLDADTLVVRNCDELFEREEFSAAPDVSWPDCFNSGVFVYTPSVETFNKLLQFAVENRSFDGGDQGLLNQFFSNWATEDIKKHLPFVYNLTSIAAYSYIPAFKHFGSETRIVHFIGTGKPWLQQLDIATRTVTPSSGSEHLAPLLQQWWDLFCEKVHPNLDKNLESNNVGMSHPSVEACSNSLAIALTDESQTPHLIEPCTPYRQKDDFRQYNLPYQPFDVKGSSGELLNVEFLLASVVPPAEQEVSSDEQQRRNGESLEEKNKTNWVDDETTNWKPILEIKKPERLRNDSGREQELIYEHDKSREDVCAIQQPEKTDERADTSEEEQNLQQTEPPPPEDPFDYHSFFPDEICINNYLEQNVVTYQPFSSHHQHHNHHHDYKGNDEIDISHGNKEPEKNIPCLPRFLTIPENDQRQSGNVETHSPEQYHSESISVLTACDTTLSVQKHEHSQKESTPQKEEIHSETRESEPILAKRELTKSKSLSHLVCDEPLWTPPRSIWKSQPDVNVDPNKKYSMPKLKPILPKQHSFSKCVSFVPKITLYTEFLMSSEYKDPVNLPHDKEGFVKTHINKEAKLRRSKSSVDVQSKFGPLPYVLSPELEKPITPKKTPLRLLDNELYDLTHCKRQLGNKPKSESSDRKKENVFSVLPTLKPIIPAKDQKSTLVKKRKLKELSPADGGREKIPKKEPKIKERKREVKPMSRNISTNANTNGDNLNEILKKLREFSKDYQHFFGVVMDTKAVTCKNSAVQKIEPDNSDCSSSRKLESLSAPVSNRVKATQFPKETRRKSGPESIENLIEDSVVRLKDKNYVKDQKETNHMGLTNNQDIPSKSINEEREAFKTRIEKLELENRSDDLSLITNDAEGKQNAMSAKENTPSKDKDKSSHPVKKYYMTHSHSGPAKNEHVTRTPKLLAQKPVKSADPVEKTESRVQCRTETESLSAEINLPNLTARRESSKVRVNDDIYWTTKSDSTQGLCCTSPSYASKTKAAEPKDLVSVHSSDQKIQQAVEDSESANIFEGHKIPCALSAEQSVNAEFLENKKIKKDEEKADTHTAKCQSSSVSNELPQVPGRVASAHFNKSNGHLNTKLSVGVQSPGINSLKQEIETHKCKNRTHSKKKIINEKDSETESPVKHSSDLNSKHLISNLEQLSQKGERSHPDEYCEDDSTTSGPYAATIQKTASSVVKSSPKLTHKEKNDRSVLQRNGAVKKEKSSPAVNDSKATSFDTKEEKTGKDAKKTRDVPDFENPQSSYKTVASELIEENSTAEHYKHVENPLLLGAPNSLFSVPREVRKPQPGPRNIPEKGCKNSEFFENRFDVLSNNFPDGTIRFVGKKTCDKKSERKTSSSPSPSTPNGGKAQPRNLEDLKSTAGIAGAIAQLSLEAGSEQNQESAVASAAHQEYLRRQNWETGNMDYMGRDSFDNIWLKICQTLETKDSEETTGSSETPTETSAKTEEKGKPKEVAPTEKPVSLSAILQNSSEYIETLPSEQASGPIEDDEIIFSKPENRQSSLTNIVEEEEVSMEVPESGVAELITENLKPLQIQQPNTGVEEMETSVTEIPSKCPKPQDELSPEKPTASGAKETDAKEEEAKIITGASHAGEEKTSLGSPAAIITEVKTRPQTEKEECKISTANQPPASSQEQPPTDEPKQSEALAEDKKGATKPAEKAEECKVVAIPSPPIVYPGAPFTEKDKTSKRLKTDGKPDVFSEPIPLPPPESPTAAPTQEPAAKNLKSDSSKANGKPKKGVFTKILEMVGVSPKEKTENELSKSVFYNVEGGVSSKEETDVMEKQVPKVEETREPPAMAEPKQSDDVKEAKQQPAEEVEQEKTAPPEESTKTEELLPSKQEEIASKTTADSEVVLEAPEVKASTETQEQKPLELKQSEKSQERKPHPKESDKKGGSKSKSQNEHKSGQESISKPARNSGSKEAKQSTESKQSAAKRKSPNRKLTMPQKPPETEVTTPTPPPQPDVPPRRNSALLKVDDTIPETPPVSELSEKKADETVEGKVMTEIDDIIGKAKSEVESLLQDRRSAEKEAGESSDLINTMKLIMGDEMPVKTTTSEEVEELRVTTEEERKRHKEEVVSSKLSDQILKAIPPPRRKAISEASASTSAIPKAPAAPEQKNTPGESKSKSSKPSSIPVPPPRNRGKPTQPAPSKGKGKK